jgi:predicted nucleic acid-binding protein
MCGTASPPRDSRWPGGGTHAHLVDLLIALTASHAGHGLLTRDRNFTAIARAVPLDVELF